MLYLKLSTDIRLVVIKVWFTIAVYVLNDNEDDNDDDVYDKSLFIGQMTMTGIRHVTL